MEGVLQDMMEKHEQAASAADDGDVEMWQAVGGATSDAVDRKAAGNQRPGRHGASVAVRRCGALFGGGGGECRGDVRGGYRAVDVWLVGA